MDVGVWLTEGFVPLGGFSRGDVVGGIVEHGLNTLVLILL